MLYYIDVSSQPIVEEFIPRIPQSRMLGEDDKIPRICLSKTLEGCCSASPELEGLFPRHASCPDEVFRLYVFDENEIQEENLIDSEYLWKNSLVQDAYITKEVWIKNQNLKPKEIKYFSINELKIKRVAMLSFEEFKEYEKEFHILEIFKEKENIPLEDFVKLTGDNIEAKKVFYDIDICFYNNDELLFPKNNPRYDEENNMQLDNFQILTLTEYFPNIEDFSIFNGKKVSYMRNFVYSFFIEYNFSETGIEFRYGGPVICKEKLLKALTK